MITFLPYLSDGGWWLVVGGWLYNDNLVVAGGGVGCFVVLLFGQLDNQTTVVSSACCQPGLSCIVSHGVVLASGQEFSGYSALSQRAWWARAASARRPLLRALRWGPRLALKEEPTKPTKPNQVFISRYVSLKHINNRLSTVTRGTCLTVLVQFRTLKRFKYFKQQYRDQNSCTSNHLGPVLSRPKRVEASLIKKQR